VRSIQNLPIGRKLGIVARLSVLIALGVALLTIFMTEVINEIRRADEDGRVLSEIVADSAISPLRFDDARVAASLLAALPNASWLLITLDDSLLAGEIAIRAQEYGQGAGIRRPDAHRRLCPPARGGASSARARRASGGQERGGGCAATLSPRHGDGLKLIGSHESPRRGQTSSPGLLPGLFA